MRIKARGKSVDAEREEFEDLLDDGDRLYAADEYVEALTRFERCIEVARDDAERAEGYCALGDALLALGRTGEALYMYGKAVDLDPEFAGGYCGEADVHFERWDLEKALIQAREALVRDPDYARAHYLMGLAYEKMGEEEAARKRFRKAAVLDPDYYPLPLRLDPDTASGLVSEAIASLPDDVHDVMKSVELQIKPIPTAEESRHYRDHDIGPQVPGILLGPDELPEGEAEKLRLVLYQKNLEKVAISPETFVEEVQKTILHEIADYCGDDSEGADEGEAVLAPGSFSPGPAPAKGGDDVGRATAPKSSGVP